MEKKNLTAPSRTAPYFLDVGDRPFDPALPLTASTPVVTCDSDRALGWDRGDGLIGKGSPFESQRISSTGFDGLSFRTRMLKYTLYLFL